jgi:hypothetical protein
MEAEKVRTLSQLLKLKVAEIERNGDFQENFKIDIQFCD